MDFTSSLTGLVNDVWGLARQPLGYTCNLRDNVNSLRTATDLLKARSTDVLARVEREEGRGGVRRTEEVACWLLKVQEFLAQVDQILPEAEGRAQIKCLRRCLPPNCWSSYDLGKKVHQKLNEAEKLRTIGDQLGDVMAQLPPPSVLLNPTRQTVGLDTSLNEVWRWLVDEKQGVIGLYGLGGVGKTTLMRKINEKISCENPGFEVVIWVVVSRQVSEETIRDTIRKRLGIEDQTWKESSLEEKVHHLCQALTRKKFVLLIDDLWARLDLSEIGIPDELQNGSKIVFTTREKQICAQMGAKDFEVRCLTTEEALKLFEKNAGESTVKSNPEIQELANKIADECKGLPLALITVGRAMAGIPNPNEWKKALETLMKKPHVLSGMQEKVYHVLEFSYDRLDDSNIQRCFLHCCLFPEDYHMRPPDLIGLWIGEGFLGDTDDVYSLRMEGERVLGRLDRACLLESGYDDTYEGAYVKMHDVIRDMATWIARDHGQKENKWLVGEREEDLSTKMISKWGDAEKVSIWGERIVNIDQIPPRCSKLDTLIVRDTDVKLVPRGFFISMAAHLKVLDLSDNGGIKSFPEEICSLINLQYLNLSTTCIQELPRDIDKLTCLRWLLLEYLNCVIIPKGAITSLPLNVLSMWESELKEEEEEEMLEELGCMQHLVDLSITVCKSSSVQKIFQSRNLQRSIRRARIEYCLDLMRIVISHSLLHLELLFISKCHNLVQMEISEGIGRAPNCFYFPSLTYISIYKCGLSDLSWLVHAPKLQELRVKRCPSLEKIIGDGFASGELAASKLFSCLEVVWLWRLPKLTSICDEALSFAEGVGFRIEECPGLRKLPLDSSSARGGSFSVSGDNDWWARFPTPDPAARVTYKRGWGRRSKVEEMTYGEARRRMEGKPVREVEIGFRPHGPSE